MKATIWKSEENMCKVQKMYEQIAILYTLDKSIYSKLADRLHKLEKEVEEKTTETDFLVDTTIAAIYLELDTFMKNKGNALLEKRQKEALKEQLWNMFDILNSDNMEEIQDKLMDEYLELAKEHNITDIICELQLEIIKIHYREYKTISVMQRVEPYKEIFMSFMAKKVIEFLSNGEMPELDKQKLSLSVVSSFEGEVCNYLSPQIMMFFVAQGEERDMMCKDELVINPLPPHDPKLYSKEIKEKLHKLDQKYEECKNESSSFKMRMLNDMLETRHILDSIEKGEEVKFKVYSHEKEVDIYYDMMYETVRVYYDTCMDNEGIFVDGQRLFSFDKNTSTYFKQMMYICFEKLAWYNLDHLERYVYPEMWRLHQMDINEHDRFQCIENDYYADQELLKILNQDMCKYLNNGEERGRNEWITNWIMRREEATMKKTIWKKGLFVKDSLETMEMKNGPVSFKFPEFYHSYDAKPDYSILEKYTHGKEVSAIADYLKIKEYLDDVLKFDVYEYRIEVKKEEIKFNKEKIEKVNAIVAEKKKLLKELESQVIMAS